MAVRNIYAINRVADQRNKETEAKLAQRNQHIDSLIEKIEKNEQQIRDVIDTIKYMQQQKLYKLAECLWEQAGLYCTANGGGCIQQNMSSCSIYLGRSDKNHLISIGWSSCGMCESYEVYRGMPNYTYEAIAKANGRTYMRLLEDMAATLEVKLNKFFELLETIKK